MSLGKKVAWLGAGVVASVGITKLVDWIFSDKGQKKIKN